MIYVEFMNSLRHTAILTATTVRFRQKTVRVFRAGVYISSSGRGAEANLNNLWDKAKSLWQ